MRSGNGRIKQLREVLSRGEGVHRGNHTIFFAHAKKDPEPDMCKECELSLKCLARPIDNVEAHQTQRPCFMERQAIHFQYHASVCLVYDMLNKRVTDNNMYGYSVTTSKNIRHYLEAIWNNFSFVDLSYTRIDEIVKAFKKFEPSDQEPMLWVPI